MTKNDLLKQILEICRKTEAEIAKHKEGKNLEKPIMSDLIKTAKAMAYENVLEQMRKYSNSRKEGRE
jgi:hypothetical protein